MTTNDNFDQMHFKHFSQKISKHIKNVEERNHSMLKALEIAQFHKEKEPIQKKWTSTLENTDQHHMQLQINFQLKYFLIVQLEQSSWIFMK